jgi:hypothetical protein
MNAYPIAGFVDPLVLASAFIMHAGNRKDNLTDAQKEIVDHPVSKLIILLGLFYISTRNLMWSLILLILYYVLIYVLLNETHPMNILSQKWLFDKGYITEPSLSNWNIIDIYFKNHEHMTTNVLK